MKLRTYSKYGLSITITYKSKKVAILSQPGRYNLIYRGYVASQSWRGICGNLFVDKRFFKRLGTFLGREPKISKDILGGVH